MTTQRFAAEVVPTHCWRLPEAVPEAAGDLARKLGLPLLLVQLLHRRGYKDAGAIQGFLAPSASTLSKPDSLPDIAPATDRILAGLERHERICVYGDYDVDGVTGTVLVFSTLRRLGADVVYYLPGRESEGYGLSPDGVRFCESQGVKLLVTVDCGTTDSESIAAAARAGIDTVVTDHHEPPDRLPPALAVVNPKRADSFYPFRELAGVGVAFKLAWSILAALCRPKEELTGLIDLVGLGTIADLVPLVGENRVLARIGLAALASTTRPGLRALLRKAGIRQGRVTSHDVGFLLAPRLNAAGRLDHAREAVELLLAEDDDSAELLAEELDAKNRSRQAIEEETFAAASSIAEQGGLDKQRVIVVARPGWPEGVIGLVASRLVERFYRPSIVISLKGEVGKGSGRSIAGFDLHAALKTSAEHLLEFGGHKYAAGLSIASTRIGDFAASVGRFAAGLPDTVYERHLVVDAIADLAQIEEIAALMPQLEPFGPENPEPLWASLGLEVVGYPRRVGKNHLKLRVRSGGRVLEAVAWQRSHELPNIEVGGRQLDICYTVGCRTHAGRTSTQLTLRDLRTHCPAQNGSS